MADENSLVAVVDCAAAATDHDDLLCHEEMETNGIFFDDGYDDFVDDHHQSNGGQGTMSFGSSGFKPLMISLPCLSEECIGWMVEREREHLPRDDYLTRLRSGELDVSLRKQALHWMVKACTIYSFGESCLYLGVSYFDRFLSVYELPICSLHRGNTTWAVQLLAVTCLFLAAKIEEVYVPSAVDLQAWEPNVVFEAKTVLRVEFTVLDHLKWKIRAYTPCNFIDYYLRKMTDGELPSVPVITRSIQIILSTIEGIDFLEFRPSEIAAAVAIYVSGETQAMDIDKALSVLKGIDKDKVIKCIEIIRDLRSICWTPTTAATSSMSYNTALSSEPHSPSGVLEVASLSYQSDGGTVESCPSSSHTSPDTKRRKLEDATTVEGGDAVDSSTHE